MAEATEFAFDYLISRRGTVSAVAAEVATVLEGEGYRVTVQDYDFKRGGNFVSDIHNALIASRNLFILHTGDYEQQFWTHTEFTSFFALIAGSGGERRICVLRCDESAPRGILATTVFGDLVGVTDGEERRKIILAVARGDPPKQRREPTIFGGAMPNMNANFFGRKAVLATIETLLKGDVGQAALPLVAICGLGGIGKSSIARAWVAAFGPDYVGVWWLNAQTRQLTVSGLAALAARFEARLDSEPDMEKLMRAAIVRIERSERPFLLIYDNLESPQMADEVLPARGAHVLITSRRSDWGGRGHELEIDSMPEDEAIAFLQARSGRRDEAGARSLVRTLGGFPLALDHAGAFVRSAILSFDAYGHSLEKFLARAPKDAPYPASVAATFSMGIENAVRECAAAETVLGHLAFFAAERIPLELLPPSLIAEDARADALMALTGVSLVRSETLSDDRPGLSLHRLVQAATRLRLAAQGKTQAAFAQAAKVCVEAFPEHAYDEPKTWPLCNDLLAHGLAIRRHALDLGIKTADVATLCDRMGQFLHGRAAFPLAEELFRDAVSIAEAASGPSSLELARAMNNLANLLGVTARRDEAEPLLRRALAIQEEKLGRDDPGSARTMTSLAWLLNEMQRPQEAELLLREALASGERKLGHAHPDVAGRINNLALMLQKLGRTDEAETLLQDAIATGERTLGRDHPLVMTRLNNLASLLLEKGKLAEAETLFRETIDRGALTLGREHPDIAARLNNLGNLLRNSARYDEAEPLYREAIAICERSHGPHHQMTARIERNLAVQLLATGRADEALRYAQHALPVHDEILGRSHNWTRDSAALCADSLASLGRSDEAAAVRARYLESDTAGT
jgi:tetratricopeptide (TPR) repeat protein